MSIFSIWLITGLPGSGKSTLAEQMRIQWPHAVVCDDPPDHHAIREAGERALSPSIETIRRDLILTHPDWLRPSSLAAAIRALVEMWPSATIAVLYRQIEESIALERLLANPERAKDVRLWRDWNRTPQGAYMVPSAVGDHEILSWPDILRPVYPSPMYQSPHSLSTQQSPQTSR